MGALNQVEQRRKGLGNKVGTEMGSLTREDRIDLRFIVRAVLGIRANTSAECAPPTVSALEPNGILYI